MSGGPERAVPRVCTDGAVNPYFLATRRPRVRCFLAHGCLPCWAACRWCPVVRVDETAVAEREGKRSSTGQMILAGWARESVPWRLCKWRLQCCAQGTVPHVTAPTVALSTLKAPFAPTPHERVFFSGRSQRPSLLPQRQQIICPVLFTPSFFGTRRYLLRLFLSGRSFSPADRNSASRGGRN